ncbi:lysozyme [Oscillibacter sp.]|jgi:GH24 family phage-related lysozyme (muramidase)|uniref:lysozyme n=1 Tax=Oscillibacter sp. TaxID=1945593 RepID=UPI0021719FCD|nr:lysozyme [Oscillibacter sp.]MCI9649696.1 lysozyme [Oscillibacter sp.]
MGRPIGEAGLALIKNFEGCRLKAYKPVSTEKYWTIGWGHYGPDVRENQIITQAEADQLLAADCQKFADAVDNPRNCPLTGQFNANQRDALISFSFNCGAAALQTQCKGRGLPQIRDAMALYNKSGGKVLNGLVRRRAAEQALWDAPVKEDSMDISKLTDAEILQLVDRIQDVMGRQQVSGTLAPELEEAKALGITDGTRSGALCTRAQAAVMPLRAAKSGTP